MRLAGARGQQLERLHAPNTTHRCTVHSIGTRVVGVARARTHTAPSPRGRRSSAAQRRAKRHGGRTAQCEHGCTAAVGQLCKTSHIMLQRSRAPRVRVLAWQAPSWRSMLHGMCEALPWPLQPSCAPSTTPHFSFPPRALRRQCRQPVLRWWQDGCAHAPCQGPCSHTVDDMMRGSRRHRDLLTAPHHTHSAVHVSTRVLQQEQHQYTQRVMHTEMPQLGQGAPTSHDHQV